MEMEILADQGALKRARDENAEDKEELAAQHVAKKQHAFSPRPQGAHALFSSSSSHWPWPISRFLK
jgi:hypothetical protein